MSDPFRIRSDLARVERDGFAFPLGVEASPAVPPRQGFSVSWCEAEGDRPDAYTFFVVLSHERLRPLLRSLFEMLPERVSGIMEAGSRDAFRAVDVFLSAQAMPRHRFLAGWCRFERIFLEDASLAFGVNAETPFMEIFVDQDKRVTIHVEPDAKDQVEAILFAHRLSLCDEQDIIIGSPDLERIEIRPVLVEGPQYICDVDQLLLALRQDWKLVLDEDGDRNIDASGRDLGFTLWCATLILAPREAESPGPGYASAWAVARSRNDLQRVVRDHLHHHPRWRLADFYTVDRVAFDDRPEALEGLSLKHRCSEMLLLEVESVEGDGLETGYPDG